jgi:hypothetical protein
MIIEQLNITRLATFHTKYDAPVGSDGNRPKALAITLQWVQTKAGQIHLFRRFRLVKNQQDVFDALEILRRNLTWVPVFEQSAQAFMPKVSDHALF